jgi:hypothetical protein
MTPIEVIASIRQTGGSITAAGGKLRVVAPPEVVNALRSSLSECKPVLLSLLAPEPVAEVDLDRPDWWDSKLTEQENRDLDQFLGWSSDAERRAIQWVESLSPFDASAVVRDAIVELDSITGCDAETCEQSEQCEQSSLSPLLATSTAEIAVANNLRTICEQSFEPVPCAKCGGISAWWDGNDNRHCDQCDPPIRSRFIAERIQSLLADQAIGRFPTRNRKLAAVPLDCQADDKSKRNILGRCFAVGSQAKVLPRLQTVVRLDP